MHLLSNAWTIQQRLLLLIVTLLINLGLSQGQTTPSPTRGENWQSAEVETTSAPSRSPVAIDESKDNNVVIYVMISALLVFVVLVTIFIIWKANKTNRRYGMQRVMMSDTDDETDNENDIDDDEKTAFVSDGL
eukprot:322147_1